MLGEDAFERTQVVVRERVRERADRGGHAASTRRRADVPVLPAVVAAAGDHLAAGVRARGADGPRRRVGPVLAEPDHLGARHDLRKGLGHLDLERMREGERDAVGELGAHRGEDVRVVVAEHDRPQRHHVVDVLVAVHVPDVAATSTLEEQRGDPLHELRMTLAERLRARRDDLAGAGEVLPGAGQRATGDRIHGVPYFFGTSVSARAERTDVA